MWVGHLHNPRLLFKRTRLSAMVLRASRELESMGQVQTISRPPSHMVEQFESEEIERVRTALAAGSDPVCPRCGGCFDRTDVPPRNDVPYVRDRIWLICVACGAGLVIDRPKTPPR